MRYQSTYKMNSNTIASANAALIGSVDWNKVDAQSIIDAMKKDEIRAPLTEWLARKGWVAEMPATSEPAIDPIIRVDRSIKPIYPDWMKKVLYPELESVGPAEYDASSIEQWLHDGQKDGKWVTGNVVYGYLKDNDLIKTCLGLRDLEEIQKKGIAFFRKHFQGKAVFGGASVVQNRDGSLHVPYLYGHGDEVVLYWRWLDDHWYGNYPALRHASSPQA